ncbi:ABC-type transport auxiliary lipoprotein family protein [Marinobacter bryozoorum]|uniref:ABC-type transport auxiliary lipoprotein family protein n=1 Tax=Marinobacter bryozoorum TaxID=256324 RepID=UPI002002C855|nr:ABC-type transport auxiliary lipoprotein family protein [Marinobacter bryozoorum]MCK7543134.1 ABC-type transport auxiliary lipoprotein family protein [Marinobacter bryozoorum]
MTPTGMPLRGLPGHLLKATLLAAISVSLTACSVALFPDKQPQRQFTLPYQFEADRAPGPANSNLPVLKVERPQASGLLGGKRIVLEVQPNELAAYSAVRWTTDVPGLLRDHLVQALRADGRLGTVVSDASGAGSQVTVSSALLSFQEDRTGPRNAVHLHLQAQLIENGSRKPLATRDFRVKVPLGEQSIEGSVAAFGRAADRLAAEAADWIASSLAEN